MKYLWSIARQSLIDQRRRITRCDNQSVVAFRYRTLSREVAVGANSAALSVLEFVNQMARAAVHTLAAKRTRQRIANGLRVIHDGVALFEDGVHVAIGVREEKLGEAGFQK